MEQLKSQQSQSRKISLDLGCGFNRSIGSGETVIGVDLNPKFLKDNKAVRTGTMLPVCADITHLPFADNTIDTVSAMHVLEHTPPEASQQSLVEAHRVLAREGTIFVAVPHPRYESILGRLIPEYHSPKMHQQVFSAEKIAQEVETAGFTIETKQTRRSITALSIVAQGILSKFTSLVEFNEQVGFVNQDPENIVHKIFGKAIEIAQKIESIPTVGHILNTFFPLETYIEASKK